jgi:hypothetical protein
MIDKEKPTHRDRLKSILNSEGKAPPPPKKEAELEGTEANCEAFGYLRGLRDSSASVEFRFRDGNSTWFSYGLLGSWQYNPSEGLLLKFSGDIVYLVLIRGSNLDKPLAEGSINLTHAGLQRNRVLWIREMTKEEIERVGEFGPTIDSIEIGEFATYEERHEWIKKKAPAFIRELEV